MTKLVRECCLLCFTREQFEYEIVSKIYCDNYIDKAMLLLAFEGIGSVDELLGLKYDAIDGKWITTPNGRQILLTEDTFSVVKKATLQKIHHEANGESKSRRNPTKKLLDTSFLVRSDVADEDGKFRKGAYQSRIRQLKRVTGVKSLAFTNITKAGILDYFFLVEAKKGKKLSVEDAKKVYIWFGEDAHTNTTLSSLKSFYQKYKLHFRLDESKFKERRDNKELDDIFYEIMKIHIPKRELQSDIRKSFSEENLFTEALINQFFQPVSEEELDELKFENGDLNELDVNSALEYFNTQLAKKPELTEPESPLIYTLSSGNNNKGRHPAFGIAVKRVYNYSCAICGSKLKTPKGRYEVQAAHIHAKEFNGRDDP